MAVYDRLWPCGLGGDEEKTEKEWKPKRVLLQEFQATWCRNDVFARFVNDKPVWVLEGVLM